jgi:hypothetical protein
VAKLRSNFALPLRSARDCSGNPADFTAGKVEELERKARFLAALAARNAQKF